MVSVAELLPLDRELKDYRVSAPLAVNVPLQSYSR